MKYEDIHASNEINCSSSGHYTVKVWYTDTEDGKRWMRHFSLEDYMFCSVKQYLDYWRAPFYLTLEVMRQLQNWLKDGTLKVYEYNRDGVKRYEDLRYHEPAHLKWLIEEMK